MLSSNSHGNLPEIKFNKPGRNDESKFSSIVNSAVGSDHEVDENGEPIKQKSEISKVPMHPDREIKQKTKKVRKNIDKLINKCKINERLGEK
tara:strand:+ start:799 stop:1074 length:276 start_codon:yes stop_codon:yes gene_type:complete